MFEKKEKEVEFDGIFPFSLFLEAKFSRCEKMKLILSIKCSIQNSSADRRVTLLGWQSFSSYFTFL